MPPPLGSQSPPVLTLQADQTHRRRFRSRHQPGGVWADTGRSALPPAGRGDHCGSQTLNDAEIAMRALVYHGPGVKAWEDVPKPAVTADTDAIVRVDATTICGTDLHILKGDVPAVTD